jgi:hypothetical protein
MRFIKGSLFGLIPALAPVAAFGHGVGSGGFGGGHFGGRGGPFGGFAGIVLVVLQELTQLGAGAAAIAPDTSFAPGGRNPL